MATTRIITREQAIGWFSLGHVGKSPSRFDLKKLENLNGHYIREADDARLASLVAPRIGPRSRRALLDPRHAGAQAARKEPQRAGRRRALPVQAAPAGDGREGRRLLTR
jgi:glutamyl/glutaminyl-tRNA synthetase